MSQSFDKVGVLGAGIMGTGIAAHLANAGLKVLLLDIPPPDGKGGRNAFAEGALAKAMKAKPAAFFHPSRRNLVEVGNLEDDLGKLADCQWVVEAVKEDLGIKRALFEKLEKILKPGTVISSNTSGLPLAEMVAGRSESFKKSFLITHFFNPVRYMKLLEIVVGPDTDPAISRRLASFAEDTLGKGVVFGKDTPNFIGNRIGTYGLMRALKEMETKSASIEEIDAIFGQALGRPKSAVFQTADLVGLDLLVAVSEHCYHGLPKDPERDLYKPPAWLVEMVKNGQLGRKGDGGFYKKAEKTEANPKGLVAWNWKDKSYAPVAKVRIDSLGVAKNTDDLTKRMKAVVFANDRAGEIAWPVLRDTLAYAMRCLGEIADDVASIDNAMKWGFNWDMGPFETWDALGFEEVAARMKAEGVTLSPWVKALVDGGAAGIYAGLGAKAGVVDDPRRRSLADRKKAGAKVVKANSGASLIDIGDDVLALEFHTKGNAIDADITTMLLDGVSYAEEHARGLVIYNEAEHFSFGANLMLIYMLAEQKSWEQVEEASATLQRAMQRIRYAKVPVVAAPHGMALGGGCEICLAAGSGAGVRPYAELYIGLVEPGVGLIPGAGGTVNTLFAMLERIPEGARVDSLSMVAQAFQQIAMAKVATSVEEARAMAYVPLYAQVTMDRRRQLQDAKEAVIGMSRAGYRPPVPRAFRLPGESGIATLKLMVKNLVEGGQATPHDALIAGKLAEVLCGGAAGHTREVTEQEMLDLERAAFLSLCGEEKSRARMAHMLTTNKPLRN